MSHVSHGRDRRTAPRLRAAALMVAAAAAVTPAMSQQDFKYLISRGLAALNAKEYQSAQLMIEKAVALRPNDAEARYLLARAYGEDKKHQFASKHLRETLRLSAGHVQALLDLASIEQNMGRFDEAGALYRRALALGHNPRAERGMASLLARQGRTGEAAGILRKLVQADPADIESRYQLGLALMQQGECGEAILELKAVVAAQPSHRGAMLNLGNCLNRVDKRPEADRVLAQFQEESREESARLDRQRRSYFLLLEADRKLEAGDADGALAALRQAITANPQDSRAHAMLGQALDARGDSAKALESFLKSAEIDPTDPVVQVEAGRLLGKAGRIGEALPYFVRAAKLDPGMPEPHLMLAAAYHELGRSSEAAAEEAIYRKLAAAQKQAPR